MTAKSVRPDSPELKSSFDFLESPLSIAARQPLLLGIFQNLQDMHISSAYRQYMDFRVYCRNSSSSVSSCFELAFRWLPKGGEASLDACVALGAMVAVTEKILLILTMHVLYRPLHPLHIAKCGEHLIISRKGVVPSI